MPEIKSYYYKPSIELVLNLYEEGLIYEKEQEDYLNWIPYKLELAVGKDKHVIDGISFSLEGLKCFIKKMEYVLNERNISSEYEKISYCGPEAEFEIIFQNKDDCWEDIIIGTEVWLNAAVIEMQQGGYFLGYKFNIRLKDLKQFVRELKEQLQALLQKGEGAEMIDNSI
jgi:hypothetical protein